MISFSCLMGICILDELMLILYLQQSANILTQMLAQKCCYYNVAIKRKITV